MGESFEETIAAVGHENVTARHASTFEVTTDDFLTEAGDCILGIEADRAPADFGPAFVEACQEPDATITATVEVRDRSGIVGSETIEGRGHPDLTFEDDRSLVGRTSDYVDDRTVMVGADRSAGDLDRGLIEVLAEGGRLKLTLSVDR